MEAHEREHEDEEAMLDAADAAEEIETGDDHPMDSDSDNEDPGAGGEDGNVEAEAAIDVQNDSIAHFDGHSSSIFTIAVHPRVPEVIATGSGDDSTFVFSTANVASPVLPRSFESQPTSARDSLPALAHLTGHTDSVSALTFTLPDGAFLITAGLDGRLRVHRCPPIEELASTLQSNGSDSSSFSLSFPLVAEAQEVPEISWLHASPHPGHPNAFALGASDGSVWVYEVDDSPNAALPLQLLQAYYLHTAGCTAGAWSADGTMLASVAEDSSLYVYDPFGDVGSATRNYASPGQAIISLTAADARFAVDGGFYSVAIAPSGNVLATGGAGGIIRIVGLPSLPSANGIAASQQASARSKAGVNANRSKGNSAKSATGSASQAGVLLASLDAQSDGVETLAFAPDPLPLLAAGSVDGSIALYDTSRAFALRRKIDAAHDGEAVVQVAFPRSSSDNPSAPASRPTASTAVSGTGAKPVNAPWMLTSCGMDGVLRRWDARGGSNAISTSNASARPSPSSIRPGAGAGVESKTQTGPNFNQSANPNEASQTKTSVETSSAKRGLEGEYHGHRGGGEGGGILGFVESGSPLRIVTAGDDGVALVFETV